MCVFGIKKIYMLLNCQCAMHSQSTQLHIYVEINSQLYSNPIFNDFEPIINFNSLNP